MRRGIYAAAGMAALLVAGHAMADIETAKAQPSGERVQVTGLVEDGPDTKHIRLNDSSGRIIVDLEKAEGDIPKAGDMATATGTLDKNLLMARLEAKTIEVNKSAAMQDPNGLPNIIKIRELPDAGMVQLIGTIEKVSDDKKFTLKDQSGQITVKVKTNEAVVLTEGAEVTVVGTVDKSLLGKSIDATYISVKDTKATTAAASPQAK